MADVLTIDVVSDVVCPWCYIGQQQLRDALAQLAALRPDQEAPVVRWHPFQLNPDMPAGGMARTDYMQRKFGSSDGAKIYQRVRDAAAEVGLALQLDRISRQPNTLKAHALLGVAQHSQQALADRLFKGYFMEGRDLTDNQQLAALATEAGLDEELVEKALDDVELHAATAQEDIRWREMGVSGVPLFVIGGKVAVPGAAGAPVLLQAMQQVLDKVVHKRAVTS
jgi:predicted DsbA family dithiol-disulfide isomerase